MGGDAMSELQFNPGEIVVLKSGGPKMTYVNDEEGLAVCTWFDQPGNQKRQEAFPYVALDRWEEPRRPQKAPTNWMA